MRAAQEGHEEIASVLIRAKANVNRKNHEGMNALMLASQRGHAGVVRDLIQNGAVTDEQTSQVKRRPSSLTIVHFSSWIDREVLLSCYLVSVDMRKL
jgi:ankyrin repeat protein